MTVHCLYMLRVCAYVFLRVYGSRYWPEFASLAPASSQAGKASLTVAEALSHRGGLTCAGGK